MERAPITTVVIIAKGNDPTCVTWRPRRSVGPLVVHGQV